MIFVSELFHQPTVYRYADVHSIGRLHYMT